VKARSIRFRLTMWYAALLAGVIALAGGATYLGLERYLEKSLDESLTMQARTIAQTLLVNVRQSGDEYVVNEINEHFAPEINGRFVRVARSNGSILFVSGTPKEKSFDPAAIRSLAGASVEHSEEVDVGDDRELLLHVLPYTNRDGDRFLVEVGAPYWQIEKVLHGLLLAFGLGLPLVLAGAAGGGYLLTRGALRPVDEITRTAERITSRILAERLPVAETGDELERLAVALNGMIARLEEAFLQLHRFSADASHELRTPLTILHGELESMAQRDDIPAAVREGLGSTLEETERLSKIVENLLTISRLEAGEARVERKPLDLSEITRSTTEQMRLLAEVKDISLAISVSDPVLVEGDPSRLKQVVVNLLDNAIKYTPNGGSVEIATRNVNGCAVLEVRDTGLGIAPSDLPHVFERFYRTDKARSRELGGSGLGLSIVKSIVVAHGGEVTVSSEDTAGTQFTVILPSPHTAQG
jgi:heavy metal sensor kinase